MMRPATAFLFLLLAVSAGLRAEIFNEDVTIQTTDPDLFLVDSDGTTWLVEADPTSAPNGFAIARNPGDHEVFVLEDDAPASTIYVDSSGRIGLGTSAPVADLDIFDPNGSSIASLGLTTSTSSWVVSTTNDEFRVTSGANPNDPAPFRIYPGAPANSIRIQSTGVSINGAVVTLSSRESKEAFEKVDTREILDRVLQLPLSRWTYKTDPSGARHLGPMAEDFHTAFGLGPDETGIATIDASGVALAAIQGLKIEHDARIAELIREHQAETASLRVELAELRRLVAGLLEDSLEGAVAEAGP